MTHDFREKGVYWIYTYIVGVVLENWREDRFCRKSMAKQGESCEFVVSVVLIALVRSVYKSDRRIS